MSIQPKGSAKGFLLCSGTGFTWTGNFSKSDQCEEQSRYPVRYLTEVLPQKETIYRVNSQLCVNLVGEGSSSRERRAGNGGMDLTKLHIDMHENVRMETIILFSLQEEEKLLFA